MRIDRNDAHRSPLAAALAAGLAATLLAAAFGTALPAGAQVPADAVLQGFEPSGDYVLVVDGEERPKAKLYQSDRAGAFLIRSAAFDSPLLLSPRQGSVATVGVMSLAQRPDGVVDILADANVAPVAPFSLDGEEVVFEVGGHEGRLRPKPPLTGSHSAAEMREKNPHYVYAGASYTPQAAAVERLRGQGREVELKVFFGSWCPVCGRFVPRLLKVEEGLDGSKIGVEYYGLPNPPFDQDPEAKKYGVKGVPTGVLLVDGEEVGRIEGHDWNIPEVAIENLLKGG